MVKPTVFYLSCFHTQLDPESAQGYSHCAFSMKNFKFASMILPHSWRCVEIGNAGSKSAAEEKVALLSEKEFLEFYPPVDAKEFSGNRAVIGSYGWPTFHERLKQYLRDNAKPGDIVGHSFGRAHQEIVNLFPHLIHAETGLGYGDAPFGCWRIFESNAWRHWHWGRWDNDPVLSQDKGQNRLYSWVIGNSFDVSDWPYFPASQNEDYVLYMGRIDQCKGMTTIAELIRENSRQAKAGKTKLLKFVFAGQGNFEDQVMKNAMRDPAPDTSFLDIEYRGPVHGRARASLVGKARCMIAPSNFIEPFNGSHVESAMSGTPCVVSPHGAFCETITQGVHGFRCNTLGDYLAGIEACKYLDRKAISDYAQKRWSLETIGKQYDVALNQLAELNGPGWYSTKSHLINDSSPAAQQPEIVDVLP